MTDTPNDPRDNNEPADQGAPPQPTTQPVPQPPQEPEQHDTLPLPPAAQQPPAAQPTTPQPTTPQPDYGAGAFGQPAATGSNPYWTNPAAHQSPYPGANPYGQNSGQPGGYYQQPTAGGAPQSGYAAQQTQPIPPIPKEGAEARGKKRLAGLVVAALIVGAVVGGASGAGVMGIYQATSAPAAKPAASTGATSITVNDAKNATNVTAVAAKASPSVVTIQVQGGQSAGTGSGVILTSDGYILTNTHVVTLDGQIAKPTIQVQDNSGHLYSATIVGEDPIVDLAVIKLNNASGLTPAAFADSSKLNVGDQAIAIGAPLGLSGTVTDGIVSALNRSIQIASSAAPKTNGDQQSQGGNNFWNFDFPGQGGNGGQGKSSQQPTNYISLPVIQTDAAINPGNSGGALLNSKGQVIGINVAIASAGQQSTGSQSGSIGVGFAIPSDLAQRVGTELMKDGAATHGLLGATVSDVGSNATTVGAQVDAVTAGGGAAKAGLQKGDIVTNFNGIPIQSPTDLTAQVRYLPAGASASITYVRNGKPYTATVTLGKLTQQ